MDIIVQKYGGTSVGSVERIQAVAEKIRTWRDKGFHVVVVLSAMSGETDRLLSIAHQISNTPTARELDVLLATGEQVSIALLSMLLNEQGYEAQSFTGMQAGIRTDSSQSKARILQIEPKQIIDALQQGKIAVVAGFQGADELGHITTLGRGGSDTTATALAAALNAKECQIYTDVKGVYTTDPRVCENATKLDEITFEEMLEMSSQGSKVLQIRSVEIASKSSVPLRVLSSFEEGSGTLIVKRKSRKIQKEGKEEMEEPQVSGIAFNRNEAKVSLIGIADEPGVAYQILRTIADANVEVDVIVQNFGKSGTNDLSFTVARSDLSMVTKLLQSLGKGELVTDAHIAKVSLVGVGMKSHSGVAAKMFQALAQESINIQMISTSEIKITVIIEERYLELAVRSVHSIFGLGAEEANEEN